MKICVLAPGPIKLNFISEGLAYYQKLISRFASFELKLPKLRDRFNRVEERIKAEEELIFKNLEEELKTYPYVVALDVLGKSLGTLELTELLSQRARLGENLLFIVGGPDGLSKKVKERANLLLSLSALTLNHELALVVLAEAIFRALSIIKGHPYHR